MRRRLGLRRENWQQRDVRRCVGRMAAGKKTLRPRRPSTCGRSGITGLSRFWPTSRLTGSPASTAPWSSSASICSTRRSNRPAWRNGRLCCRAIRGNGPACRRRHAAPHLCRATRVSNYHLEKTHTITFNPIYAVELEQETRAKLFVWTPEQVAQFLDYHADDRLIFLWRLALLRGFRRGELAGMPDDAFDPAAATILVNVALLHVGSKLVWGKPKSKAGERVVGLDAGSVKEGNAHRAQRRRERLAAGAAWENSGCMFTYETGEALTRTGSHVGSQECPAEDAGCPSSSSTALGTSRRRWPSGWHRDQGRARDFSAPPHYTHHRRGLYQQVSVQMQIRVPPRQYVALLPRARSKDRIIGRRVPRCVLGRRPRRGPRPIWRASRRHVKAAALARRLGELSALGRMVTTAFRAAAIEVPRSAPWSRCPRSVIGELPRSAPPSSRCPRSTPPWSRCRTPRRRGRAGRPRRRP